MFELWQEHLPEFADAYFFTSGPVAGARESRRIVGDYVLTGEDVRQGQRHDDVVVLGAWRLDRHPAGAPGYHAIPWTPPYDIPFRTLLPRNFANLLVAGRCHSKRWPLAASPPRRWAWVKPRALLPRWPFTASAPRATLP
jgi:hypothetical protein